MMNLRDLRSVGVSDDECFGIFLFDPPGCKSSFFVA